MLLSAKLEHRLSRRLIAALTSVGARSCLYCPTRQLGEPFVLVSAQTGPANAASRTTGTIGTGPARVRLAPS
jgi:hypothetical protein